MTEQRERVITDPGIGPVDADNTATLRSIEAAVEVEPDGASLYYEPKPLVAVSDHRTLEMQTVKLSEAIDPRKLPTQLSLPRASVPPRFDSGWPQAEVVLTSSQPPAPLRRRWRVPVLLCGVLAALLLLVVARSSVQRAAEQSAASALRVETVALPAPIAKVVPAAAAAPVESSASASSPPARSAAEPVADALASASAPSAGNEAAAPDGSAASAPSASGIHALPAPAFPAPHHPALKANALPSASNPTQSAAPAKPKRAIY